MNPDSKLEDIKKRQGQGKYREHRGDIAYLLMVAEHRDTIISQQKWDLDKNHIKDLETKVKEQDQEIAGLRLDGWVDLSARIAEQDREIERHLDRSVQLMAEKHYQRRHRRWALEQASYQLHEVWQLLDDYEETEEQIGIQANRAEKAEAELEECHGRLMAYRDSTTELIASEQTLKARVKELEAEKEKT